MASIDYATVFHSTKGVGGFVSKDANDHAFAFDGSFSGRRDHVFFYNAGTGKVYILRRDDKGNFNAIYNSDKEGVGGWDFSFYYDRALAFDYDSSGKMDHIVCYRPGSGGIFILEHDGQGGFGPVYAQSATDKPGKDDGLGIGGFDLRYPWDHILAFDLDRTGCNDALFIWTSALGRTAIIKRYSGQFVAVHKEYCKGIGDYPMQYEGDWAIAYDWTHTGFDDHLFLFNRIFGSKKPIAAVMKRQGNMMVTVYRNETSIGPWPGHANQDFLFAFDGEGKGRNSYLGLYHPGGGEIWLMTSKNSDGVWTVVKKGSGIGGNDLKNTNDKIFAFDYEGKGTLDYFFVWRRGTGDVQILKRK